MNNITRRNFLKGLATLAGGIAIAGIPDFAMAELPEIELVESLRKYGRLGAVRLHDQWFPLEDSAITMIRRYAPLYVDGKFNYRRKSNGNVAGDNDKGDYKYPIPEKRDLVNSPWQIELSLGEDPYVILDKSSEIEFEIDAHYASFVGTGYLYGWGTEIIHRDERMLYTLSLEGDSKLLRHIA